MPIPLVGADANRRLVDPDHDITDAAVLFSLTASF